jgi:transcriptional regulator with XRE-family HTH domain
MSRNPEKQVTECGNAVRCFRHSLGFTQQEFAEAIGLKRASSISNYESQGRRIKPKVRKEIVALAKKK